MITKENLIVGNTLYVRAKHSGCNVTVTKVGRKYTYTSNDHIVIENATLHTKHTARHSRYPLYKSKEQYEKLYSESLFIRAVKIAINQRNLTFDQAKQLNEQLALKCGLGEK